MAVVAAVVVAAVAAVGVGCVGSELVGGIRSGGSVAYVCASLPCPHRHSHNQT